MNLSRTAFYFAIVIALFIGFVGGMELQRRNDGPVVRGAFELGLLFGGKQSDLTTTDLKE